MSVNVFVPSHITGFFNIENHENPLINGSCGAGFLLDKGVKTHVKTSFTDETSIKINGKQDLRNETIILKVLELLDVKEPLSISQKIEVPIGAGFGTSASSALGVSICISKLLDLDHDLIKSGQIAHLAEVSLGSGLGDVIAELGQGLVLRTKAGAPGIGEITSFSDEKLFVGCKSFGEIETSAIIQNPSYKKIISSTGLKLKNEFIKNPSVSSFLDKSYEFSIKTNLMSRDVSQLVEIFNEDENILGSSMAMLGNTVFAFAYDKNSLKNMNINGLHIYELDNIGIRL